MGYIEEVMMISKDLQQLRYTSKQNIISRLQYKYYTYKLKKSINSIKDNVLSTKLVSEYADYYLQVFHTHSDIKNHIKQILKGNYDNAGSITFEISLPDFYQGVVVVNFNGRYSDTATYVFLLYGPNSSSQLNYTYYNVSELLVNLKDDSYTKSIGKTNVEKLEVFKYIFITETIKEIKKFLLSNIEAKEISVNGKSS